MKKTLFFLLSITTLSTLMTFSSCKKEKMGDGTQFRATMESCTDRYGKTSLNGTALNWIAGDRIAVYGSEGRGIYSATPLSPATTAIFNHVRGTVGEGMYRAFYPSTLTMDGINVTLPAVQNTVDGSLTNFPMYAQSEDNTLVFKNLCGVLKLHLTKADISVRSIDVSVSTPVNGDFVLRYNGVPTISYMRNGNNRTRLQCETPQPISNGKDFYIYLPHGNYSSMTFTIIASDGSVCTKSSKENVSIYITRSQYTSIVFGENDLNFHMPDPPEGALPGYFSVSATKKVFFSQGNLQYQPSTGTWQFAEHQYDYVGEGNANTSSNYSGWKDLFEWGTCMPGWRTLTDREWHYLLDERTGAASKSGIASIDGVDGVVILPDNWILPLGCTFSDGINYTLLQWARMEANGAVFLPLAGTLNDYSVADWGGEDDVSYQNYNEGHYWTSSIGRMSVVERGPLYLIFGFFDGGFDYTWDISSNWPEPVLRKKSVRLVQDIN